MPDQQGIFKGRTPEAAALQTARVLAWLTEANLATLQRMELKRSTPKNELLRQQQICDKAVDQCHDLGIEPSGLWGFHCALLAGRLSTKINKREPT